MRTSKFILLALAIALTCTLTACAPMTGPEAEALSRIIGRRIGLHGMQLNPGLFTGLAITADQACQQLPEGGTPADAAFTLIVKAIETKTDDPFLAQDLKDVIQIIGIDLDPTYKVLNLTPQIQDALLQFVCSFAQGVLRAKQNL